MSDEQQDVEETSPQRLSTSKPIPLYQPDEFQEYLTLDAPPLPPATAPSFLYASNAHPVSSPVQAPARAIPPLRRKRADRKDMLVLLLALLLVGVTGGGFLFYALRLYSPPLHSKISSIQKNLLVQTPTPSSPQALFTQATSGIPVLYDSLLNESTSTWHSSQDESASGHCAFLPDGYHVVETVAGIVHYCISRDSLFMNFAFQVQMTINNGDAGGMIFRGDFQLGKSSLYRFQVDPNGGYGLYMYVDRTAVHSKILLEGASPSIRTGVGQMNVLTVIAIGKNIYLYANSHILARTDDNTFSIGEIGLAAADFTNPTDVDFQQVEVWNL